MFTFITDLQMWRPNLATAAVGVLEPVEDAVLAHRLYTTTGILGSATGVPLQNDDDYDDGFKCMALRG